MSKTKLLNIRIDPELKKKAKEFGDSAVKSANEFGGRFKDEEVKEKFKGVGQAVDENCCEDDKTKKKPEAKNKFLGIF